MFQLDPYCCDCMLYVCSLHMKEAPSVIEAGSLEAPVALCTYTGFNASFLLSPSVDSGSNSRRNQVLV